MSVSGISSSVSMLHASQSANVQRPEHVARQNGAGDAQGAGFAERIEQAVERVNDAQSKASESAKAFETGQTDNLAAVMVDQQVASLGFQMTMQVRNKALSAYRDIMNMPV